jgi:hypothetical protein
METAEWNQRRMVALDEQVLDLQNRLADSEARATAAANAPTHEEEKLRLSIVQLQRQYAELQEGVERERSQWKTETTRLEAW